MLRAVAAMLHPSWKLLRASLQHLLHVSFGPLRFEG